MNAPLPDLLQRLTPHQRDVLALWLDGRSADEIAAKLGGSQGTVLRHLHHIRVKLHLPAGTWLAWVGLAREIGRLEGQAEERQRHGRRDL